MAPKLRGALRRWRVTKSDPNVPDFVTGGRGGGAGVGGGSGSGGGGGHGVGGTATARRSFCRKLSSGNNTGSGNGYCSQFGQHGQDPASTTRASTFNTTGTTPPYHRHHPTLPPTPPALQRPLPPSSPPPAPHHPTTSPTQVRPPYAALWPLCRTTLRTTLI